MKPTLEDEAPGIFWKLDPFVGMDLYSIALIIGLIFIARFIVFKLIYAFWRLFGLKEQKELQKLSESGFKILYWFPAWCWGFYLAYEGGWISNPELCWTHIWQQDRPPRVLWYYGVQLSWYCFTQIAHMTFDVKRKDYWPMFIHHMVTILLIVFSWYYGYFRIGVVIFVTMDLVDVFLELAKFFNYLKVTILANTFSICLILVWIVFRLGCFPLVAIKTVWIDVGVVHSREGFEYNYTAWQFFASLLIILQFLQIYWFGLILKALYKMLKTGSVEDPTDKQHFRDKKDQ